jgi:hypothetical protein
LEQILDQVGSRVELFWQRFPKVVCTQHLVQSKLDEKGKDVVQERSSYEYTISLGFAGADLAVGEELVPKDQVKHETDEPLLVSQGFSLLVMIFHPHFRNSFQYFLESDESLQGKPMHRIRFEQKPGAASPSLLQVHGKDFPIEWQGTAWIDPETLVIGRIQTNLKRSLEDLGLMRLQSEVLYGLVEYEGGQSYWLPQVATVEADSRRQHWRNVHRFTDYKRFTVDTKIMIEEPQ